MNSIGIVLVTFNRLDKLKKSLEQIINQTRKPEAMVIVNNASTDGTKEYLEAWSQNSYGFAVEILNLPSNTGGSGGFYSGLEAVLKYSVDWIWLQDDDVYANSNAFEIAMNTIPKIGDNNIVAIGSKVITRGEVSLVHRRYIAKRFLDIKEANCPLSSYTNEFFKVDLITFAGGFIKKSAVELVGLPERDFFIWQDDTEYCYRLNKIGTLYCIPAVEIDHDIDENQGKTLTWKEYYGWRNEMIKYRKHFPRVIFCFKIIKRYLKGVYMLIKRGPLFAKIWFQATRDGMLGVRGLHPIYKPGWKPEKISQ